VKLSSASHFACNPRQQDDECASDVRPGPNSAGPEPLAPSSQEQAILLMVGLFILMVWSFWPEKAAGAMYLQFAESVVHKSRKTKIGSRATPLREV
jgi:hypothetical protein